MKYWINQCHLGDCLEVLRQMPGNSVDSVVSDPPYGLNFMGKKWDYDVPSVEIWAECLRVLKPGGYLLAFAGTRTQHRMACRIEDAGFEIRDMLAWLYSSGFPKSHNGEWGGTALKPALEPITMARKPLIGTVEANWRVYGTGALNIAGCRVGESKDVPASNSNAENNIFGKSSQRDARRDGMNPNIGRWPANLIHDGSDCVVAGFPVSRSSGSKTISISERSEDRSHVYGKFPTSTAIPGVNTYADAGSAARFFYCAKASAKDRNEGLGAFRQVRTGSMQATADGSMLTGSGNERTTARANHHPTVKPTDLMRYLCRLVTPPGGIVLDPFMGSGSTCCAAVLEGFQFIGIEREAEYIEIARARIDNSRRQGHQPSLDLEAT